MTLTPLLKLEDIMMNKRIGVVINDAGAANQIISLLTANNIKNLRVYATGPGAKLWSEVFKSYTSLSSISEVLDWAEISLIGTGWATQTEKKALFKAIKKGIPCIAYFDHWSNYAERLQYHNEVMKPSTIWVADVSAKTLAETTFPDVYVEQVPNYYLANEVKKISKVSETSHTALYICEPIRENGLVSFSLTKAPIVYAISKIKHGYLGSVKKLIIRPHPSQSIEEFDFLNQMKLNFKISISWDTSLYNDISESLNVIGYHSFALVIAHMSGRKIFCSAPLNAVCSEIPFVELNYLRDMIK
jgi:hypothetical protein